MATALRSFRSLPLTLGALTLVAALGAQAQPGPGHEAGWGHGPGSSAMFGGHIQRLLDRVGATPEQRAQIQQILQRSRAEGRTQHEAGRQLREQAVALFAQPTIDPAAVEALRQKQLAQVDATSRRMMQTMLDVGNVLTPDQRKQMADYMQQRRDLMQRQWRERQNLQGGKG